jgi:Cof subfamily protein (haloacid dehalogenase superfamily)
MRKVIFLDVDGTLIDYEGKLPASAREAVIKARDNGHLVYICTGCSKSEIEAKHWDFELDGMIGGNGCYIESQGKVVAHKTLTLEQCRHFVDWCNKRDLAFRLECNDGMYISEGYELKSRRARLEYARGKGAALSDDTIVPLNPAMIDGGNLLRDDVNKTGFVLKSYQDYLDAVEEFPGLKVGTWGGKGEAALYGDVGVPNINKADAIRELLAYLGADTQDAIGFGDAKVDIPMFECCGYSVAMGNSGPETMEAADYVTADINDDGLYKAFEYLHLI